MPDKPFKMFNPKGRDLGASMPGSNAAPMTDNDQDSMGGGKMQADQAGYMELDGATKDADCSKVQVDGGVSSDLGCCNEYSAQEGSQEFKCGTCTFVLSSSAGDQDSGGTESGPDSQPDNAANTGANPATARA